MRTYLAGRPVAFQARCQEASKTTVFLSRNRKVTVADATEQAEKKLTLCPGLVDHFMVPGRPEGPYGWHQAPPVCQQAARVLRHLRKGLRMAGRGVAYPVGVLWANRVRVMKPKGNAVCA